MNQRFILFLLLLPALVGAQDPKRFEEEIRNFENGKTKYDVVFTGSSSIRLWESLENDFQHANLVNTGFGGSQMSDLVFYAQESILDYQPEKVFIYAGDNDINDGKAVEEVIENAKELEQILRTENPKVQLYFISAKPSPSRFHLKAEYEAFNLQLKAFCDAAPHLNFIDIWSPMIDADGQPDPGIFMPDQLHMDPQGYLIWEQVIGPYLD
jgi:lysophospholipase L1-like esterase